MLRSRSGTRPKDFVTKAFTVIFLASVIIWFLQTFDTRLQTLLTDSAQSLLAPVGSWIAADFRPLGLGDWRISTALITGFTAKESVVSTLTVLLGGSTGGAGKFVQRPDGGKLSGVFAALYSLRGCHCIGQAGAGRQMGADCGSVSVCSGMAGGLRCLSADGAVIRGTMKWTCQV